MDALHWDHRTEPPLRDPAMVAAFTGWNDAASAASAALGFVGARLKADRVATIDAEEFYDYQVNRPQVDLSGPGPHTLTWPEVEIAVARVPDAPRDLVLVSGAEPSLRWRAFCALLLDVADQLGAGMLVTMGALLADVPHTRPVRLTGMSSADALVAGPDLREASYQGPTGIVGALHHLATERGLQTVSLWAPSSHYAAGVTNAKASLALGRALERVTGVDAGASGLQGAALAFEKQVSMAVDADPRLRTLVEQLERAADEEPGPDPSSLPSGDELARELERFLRDQEGGGDA